MPTIKTPPRAVQQVTIENEKPIMPKSPKERFNSVGDVNSYPSQMVYSGKVDLADTPASQAQHLLSSLRRRALSAATWLKIVCEGSP